jgi:4-diphosphocytidyl-2-C-methyl-D-erythritol kinase
MATRVRSYSKINLGLAIGPVRADGFHGLVTLYQTLGLCDLVTVEARLLPEGSGSGATQSSNAGLQPAEGLPPGPGPAAQARVARAFSPNTFRPNSGLGASALGTGRVGTGGVGQGGLGASGLGPAVGGVGRAGRSRVVLTTNHPGVPTDERNTAWKMVELALKRLGVAAEVTIHIQKELPVQGGMGAGSANAAAALLGLERELGVEVPGRMELAAEVGSDVPLFLIGGAVLGEGRGEVVSAMPDLPATWCVVAVPEVGVSTPRAFQEWDGLCADKAARRVADPTSQNRDVGHPDSGAGLTSPSEPDKLEQLSHAYASVFGVRLLTELAPDTSGIVRGLATRGDTRNDLAENTLLALVRTGIENDFETVVFPQYPLLREIKHELMGTSTGSSTTDVPADASGYAVYAALSGSGSALFGLYKSEADAKAAQQRVQATGCKALLTETLPRQEYWRRMFAE